MDTNAYIRVMNCSQTHSVKMKPLSDTMRGIVLWLLYTVALLCMNLALCLHS